MKTYIVAPTRRAFDGVVRSMNIDRREAVYISNDNQTRGLILQPEQVIYADGCGLLPDLADIRKHLTRAIMMGTAQSREDQRTHRVTVTDMLGNTVGTRMVTDRQAKDILG